MGLPIIGHLVRAGFPVVVYDVDPAKRETVAGKGATFVTDSGEVAARCGTVLSASATRNSSTSSCSAAER
jgi:3-hydroxyisobutyrate dehydrogenase-like beta-hydroxyacid dehydrogenase